MTERASNGRTRDDGPSAIREKIIVELESSTIPHRVFFALHAEEIRTLLDLGFGMKAAWRRLRKGTPPYRGSYATFRRHCRTQERPAKSKPRPTVAEDPSLEEIRKRFDFGIKGGLRH